MAVSIHSVVEDLFEGNLTSESEAKSVVNDMVDNILTTSNVLNNENSNVSVSGDDIVTELATISSITSNADTVDSDSTTADLVEDYLPDIFEVVDLFIHLTAANTSSWLDPRGLGCCVFDRRVIACTDPNFEIVSKEGMDNVHFAKHNIDSGL